jgi:hypothetical protein
MYARVRKEEPALPFGILTTINIITKSKGEEEGEE